MKNPYDTLQANHTAPYYVWNATGLIEQAEVEIERGIKEMQRTNGPFESDVIGELEELLGEIRGLIATAERAEKETLTLWDDHHNQGAAPKECIDCGEINPRGHMQGACHMNCSKGAAQ